MGPVIPEEQLKGIPERHGFKVISVKHSRFKTWLNGMDTWYFVVWDFELQRYFGFKECLAHFPTEKDIQILVKLNRKKLARSTQFLEVAKTLEGRNIEMGVE